MKSTELCNHLIAKSKIEIRVRQLWVEQLMTSDWNPMDGIQLPGGLIGWHIWNHIDVRFAQIYCVQQYCCCHHYILQLIAVFKISCYKLFVNQINFKRDNVSAEIHHLWLHCFTNVCPVLCSAKKLIVFSECN